MCQTLLFFLGLVFGAFAINNGVGMTPPMGWNTWCSDKNCESDYCDEKMIFDAADALVSSGLAALGYKYVNLDDCWAGYRNKSGYIQPEPSRFPRGMKTVADYVHEKGLLFGLYTCSGYQTCVGGRPGSYGHYEQDAQSFAEYGIDFLKMDWCFTEINGTQLDPKVIYSNMSSYLNATGRPIFFSMCEWGVDSPWLWGSKIANSWRIRKDHHDSWKSTLHQIEDNLMLGAYAGPGGWNDMDFLMTGGQMCNHDGNKHCPGQSKTKYMSEFSLWSIFAAPLIFATDVRRMDETMKEVLFNQEVIAVNQDPKGMQGYPVKNPICKSWFGDNDDDSKTVDKCLVLVKELNEQGTFAVLFLNSGDIEYRRIGISFSEFGSNSSYAIRDLWEHKDLGIFQDEYISLVRPGGSLMLTVKKVY